MSRTLILGGGGMIGQKLAARLAATSDATVDLFDIGFPKTSAPGTQIIGSVTSEAALMQLAAQRYDVIYHLASIVSGEAEQDFAKGWQTNMLPMWQFLELLRAEHDASGGTYVPRVVFTSSIAVFGGPYPDVIDDDFRNTPATSYGAQKSVCELMLSDMSRKGYVDGISIRLPTICVRPGKPNAAASGFFSGIIREPLNGKEAILPVSDAVRAWSASPRAAARFLTHAAGIDLAPLGARRALNMPGLSCTVAEQIEALRRVAGQEAVDRIKHVPDPAIQTIVDGWPRKFDAARATALGFEAETTFDEIIAVYLEDDLERPRVSPRVACIGEAMIELRPRGTVADLGVAGDTLNTAVALKRCAPQLQVDYITQLGTDAFSDLIAAFIAAQGIGTAGITRDPEGKPGLYAISTDETGARSFQYWRDGSAARQLFADGRMEALAGYDLIYLSGITLAILSGAARTALHRWLADHGVKLAFDSNYRAALWPTAQSARLACAGFEAQADIVLPSLEDEIAMSGESEAQIVARLTALPVLGALKRAERGPVCLGGHVLQDYPAAPQVVDSTGAGDAFNGAYLAALLSGRSEAQALMAGHEMAMQVVQVPGAILPAELHKV